MTAEVVGHVGRTSSVGLTRCGEQQCGGRGSLALLAAAPQRPAARVPRLLPAESPAALLSRDTHLRRHCIICCPPAGHELNSLTDECDGCPAGTKRDSATEEFCIPWCAKAVGRLMCCGVPASASRGRMMACVAAERSRLQLRVQQGLPPAGMCAASPARGTAAVGPHADLTHGVGPAAALLMSCRRCALLPWWWLCCCSPPGHYSPVNASSCTPCPLDQFSPIYGLGEFWFFLNYRGAACQQGATNQGSYGQLS